MDLSEFHFDLPENLIALRPADPQDSARLLVVHADGRLEDACVRDLPAYLNPGDVLVFNDTRVLPAALTGIRPARDQSGQDVEIRINLTGQQSENTWLALARPGRRLAAGDEICFAQDFSARVEGQDPGGEFLLRFNRTGADFLQALEQYGQMPLPPYIARRRPADEADRRTYQTHIAGEEARSVAAPTAGLHFTPRLLAEADAAGLVRESVRLHVGPGTFRPLEERHLAENRLHAEWRRVSPEVAGRLNAARRAGARITAIGTTAMRTLESSADETGIIHPCLGPTDIFLKPGDRIRATDALMTNFHLPRSSLFMLVCALMGTGVMQAAYSHAIDRGYRFYSYGDACLLLP